MVKDVRKKVINNYFLVRFINDGLLGDWEVGFEGIWDGKENEQ